MGRKRPVGNQIKLGLGRAVAIGGNILTNILDKIGVKFTFLELESYAVLHKNITDAFKKVEKGMKISGPKENVINDNTTAKVSSE